MFRNRYPLFNVLDDAGADGGAGEAAAGEQTDAGSQEPSQEQGQEKAAVLDDNANPNGATIVSAQQYLTQFEGDELERATAYVKNYTDGNGNLNVANMIKSGFNLESKFGGFTGAPEQYDIKTPDFLDGDVDAEDPYIAEFMEAAKEGNMSNDMFNKLMDIHLRASIAPPVDVDVLRKEVGTDFDAMRANMAGFYKQKLDADEFKTLNGLINSPEAFKTLYKVFQASRPTKVEDKVRENFNQAELKDQMESEYLAVDQHGNPKMRDPMYAKAWRERWEPFISENG